MLIGREKESRVLKGALASASSEFIAVYGRRRVGKTYLIRETYDDRISFYHTGIANVGRKIQLERFAKSLQKQGMSSGRIPANWYEAFDLLEAGIAKLPQGKKVVFIDELPWMDTQKSNFVSALEAFWNGWASARNDIVLVVCGSATSWMTDKLIKARGGLHNRLTHRIKLEPFSLSECERFLAARGIVATRLQMLEYYMAMGGVPYYWNYIERGKSPAQNIDAMFFAPDGELRGEYEHLYASLFRKPQHHIAVVTALGTKKVGMTRGELLKATHSADNGAFGKVLSELVECGFLRRYRIPGKQVHDAVYQLIDNFTLFHFRFLADLDEDGRGTWMDMQNTPAANAWRGLAFERVCLAHAEQIKGALGISGMRTRCYAWRSPKSKEQGERELPGAQIDLLIERADNAVNICEMKYSAGEYEIDRDESRRMLNRRERFMADSGSKAAVYLTFVTTCGLVHNMYWNDVQSEVTLDDLFAF